MPNDENTSQQPRQIGRLQKTVRETLKDAKYPIRDVDDLVSRAGGEESKVNIGGRGRKVGVLRKVLTPEQFPIESEEDLVALGASLEFTDPEATVEPGEEGERQDPSPDRTPPSEDVSSVPLPKGVGKGPSIVVGRR